MNSLPGVDLPLATADMSTLGRVYIDALNSFADAAAQLSPEQWTATSPCPGWTAGDVVAHVIGIEREMHGEPLPNHEPDWAGLPHADNIFSRYTEIPVDLRRSLSQDEVLAELRDVVAWRASDIPLEGTDPAEVVIGPGGQRREHATMTRIRILDVWLHEQDLRAVLDVAGNLGSDAAWVTAERLLLGMPRVWAKSAGAPVGASLRLHVVGPGVHFDRVIIVEPSGRAELGAAAGEDQSTTTIELAWPLFADLAAGRTGAGELARNGSAHVAGDTELAAAFLERMSIMP